MASGLPTAAFGSVRVALPLHHARRDRSGVFTSTSVAVTAAASDGSPGTYTKEVRSSSLVRGPFRDAPASTTTSFAAGIALGAAGALGIALVVAVGSDRWARRRRLEEDGIPESFPWLPEETHRRMATYGRMDPFMRRNVRVEPPPGGGAMVTEYTGASYAEFEELGGLAGGVDAESLQRLRDEFEDPEEYWAAFDPADREEDWSPGHEEVVKESEAEISAKKARRLSHYASVRADARGVAWPVPGATDDAVRFPFNADMLQRRALHARLGAPREPQPLSEEFPLPPGMDGGPGGGGSSLDESISLAEVVDGRRADSAAVYPSCPPPERLAPREACQALAYALLREGGDGELTRLGKAHPIFSTPSSPLSSTQPAPLAGSNERKVVYECPLGSIQSGTSPGDAYSAWLEGIGRRGCVLRILNAFFGVPPSLSATGSTADGSASFGNYTVSATWQLDVPVPAREGEVSPTRVESLAHLRINGETDFFVDSDTSRVFLVRDAWQTSREGSCADGAEPGTPQWELGWRTSHTTGIGRLNNPLPVDAPDPSAAAKALEMLAAGLPLDWVVRDGARGP